MSGITKGRSSTNRDNNNNACGRSLVPCGQSTSAHGGTQGHFDRTRRSPKARPKTWPNVRLQTATQSANKFPHFFRAQTQQSGPRQLLSSAPGNNVINDRLSTPSAAWPSTKRKASQICQAAANQHCTSQARVPVIAEFRPVVVRLVIRIGDQADTLNLLVAVLGGHVHA